MKKLYVVAFVLLITASFSFTNKVQEKSNKLTATYLGLTEDQYYKFVDADKKEYLFYDYSDDIDISLEDDENLNKKFAIIWVEKEINESNDEEEESDKTIKVKTITALKLLK
ncbi:hypothetical protein BW723_05170 [Polaribacter reichenbachii]|uniref:Uncharacterized protein n=1 Tax=Polaribacter reichenbachii TaxID=996801 RepID=A0A1B8TUI7_9FLAO|nr:hypothetical protein [Polaribacter reichenbachii]APZ45725.1 hypothetical protein BW723_05170 [Polaribacter reichenbachii]AUC19586.1 hypothetical protein BTO17_13180 [Polaribacter reichenbachii]OBY63260.1 hypothetical protein LPB301_10540 [Polaribacter reichenbachii]